MGLDAGSTRKQVHGEDAHEVAGDGDRSPDGRWVAARIPSVGGRLPQMWVAATDKSSARLVQQDLAMYGVGLWSPSGTYLYYSNPDDSWREVDPASGQVKPFLPNVLKGQQAGSLRFSPDGRRLLYTTGLCYCNRPAQGPLTTFVVNTDGMEMHQVAVNVDALWDGNRVVLSPAGFYPPDARTGQPEIDRVIGALALKDEETLSHLIKPSRVACTAKPSGPGELPCPPGTPDGTRIEVFPTGSCQPNFVPASESLRGLFRDLIAHAPAVYAVYQVHPAQGGGAAGAYGIIVAGLQEPFPAQTLILDASGAIVQQFSCGGPRNMVPQGADFVLPPKSW